MNAEFSLTLIYCDRVRDSGSKVQGLGSRLCAGGTVVLVGWRSVESRVWVLVCLPIGHSKVLGVVGSSQVPISSILALLALQVSMFWFALRD